MTIILSKFLSAAGLRIIRSRLANTLIHSPQNAPGTFSVDHSMMESRLCQGMLWILVVVAIMLGTASFAEFPFHVVQLDDDTTVLQAGELN